MKLIIAITSLIVPLFGVLLVIVFPGFKDGSLDLIFFLRDTFSDAVDQIFPDRIADHVTDLPDDNCLEGGDILMTTEHLAQFDGLGKSDKRYASYLGVIYDVTSGKEHFGPGRRYEFYVGQDASRAYVTGDLTDSRIDNVTDLDIDDFAFVKQWEEFYEENYPRIGRLIGTYYDEMGCTTPEGDHIVAMFEKLRLQDSVDKEDLRQFPRCNKEYQLASRYLRVWCAPRSGGIDRSWVGVPRQLYLPKCQYYRCACVRNEGPPTPDVDEFEEFDNEYPTTRSPIQHENVGDLKNPRVKEFPNCHPKSFECILSPSS